MTRLVRTDSSNVDFRNMVKLLDADLRLGDGEEHGFYATFNKIDHLGQVLVAYLDNEPVACGAFKPFDDDAVEIKRMFVTPEYRGRQIALQVLTELEKWANELNYKACVLETGKKQPEAIGLYAKQVIRLYPIMASIRELKTAFACVKLFKPLSVNFHINCVL